MKRSPGLVGLSHDHHHALFVALQLKRASDPREATAAFLKFWRDEGMRHFRAEEDVLLPGWFEHDPHADPGMAARVLDEHLTMRTIARRLEAGTPPLEDLVELGEMLERHVRFEERELFPRIEASLSDSVIADLGSEMDRAEAGS